MLFTSFLRRSSRPNLTCGAELIRHESIKHEDEGQLEVQVILERCRSLGEPATLEAGVQAIGLIKE